jgi:hypothetical protein
MKLIESRLKLAEYARSIHHVTPEPGTPLREMLKPEYWAHVARKMKVGDRIEVDAEERTWFAELYVRGVTPTSVAVVIMRTVEFNKPESEEDAGAEYSAKHAGRGVWRVIRNSDKAIVQDSFPTKEAAESWIANPMAKAA